MNVMKRTKTWIGIKSLPLSILLGVSWFLSPTVLLALDVSLQSSIDTDCDGSANNSQQVKPGECILYTTRIINPHMFDVHNIEVKLQIPEYTDLHQYYGITDPQMDQSMVDVPLLSEDKAEGVLRLNIPVLEQGGSHALSVGYSVRVRD